MTDHPLCAVDQRPVHDGGQLCAACWADLEHDLTEVVASLADDLDITLAGLGRSGGSPIGIVVRSASRGIGFDERAGDLARSLHNCLGGWVRVLFEDTCSPAYVCSICLVEQQHHAEGPAPRERFWYLLNAPMGVRDDPADLARWLGEHEREIRRHEAASELWQEIHDLVEQVRRVVDRRPDRQYLGVCSEPIRTEAVLDEHGQELPEVLVIERCDADLYAIDGRPTVDCRACGARHHVEHRRKVLLDAVDDQLGTASEIARALAAYADVELKVERVRKWYSRGQIAQYPPRDGDRWPRYRVGDVRELIDPTTRKAG